jgi:hypothetical protein
MRLQIPEQGAQAAAPLLQSTRGLGVHGLDVPRLEQVRRAAA